MAAVIERTPVVTPDLPDWQQHHLSFREHYVKMQKVYPKELTSADEGPDQTRARQRVEMILERDGGRLGAGDKQDIKATTDRKLSQRLYLLLCVDGKWQFPQALRLSAPACVRLPPAF